jgi:hypothetical protein
MVVYQPPAGGTPDKEETKSNNELREQVNKRVRKEYKKFEDRIWSLGLTGTTIVLTDANSVPKERNDIITGK